MRLTAMVVFILIGSRVFSLVFQGVDGAKWVEHMLTGLPGGQIGFLIVGQPLHLLPGVLPRLLRDRLHHPADAGAGGGQDGHRPGLVRRAAVREHADRASCTRRSASRCSTCAASPTRCSRKAHAAQPVQVAATSTWARFPGSFMQVLLVAIVIFVPQTVTVFLDKEEKVDIDKVKIEMPADLQGPTAAASTGDDPFGNKKLRRAGRAADARARSCRRPRPGPTSAPGAGAGLRARASAARPARRTSCCRRGLPC